MCKGGSNTDSGSKRGVYYKNTTRLYLAFIIRNLILNNLRITDYWILWNDVEI